VNSAVRKLITIITEAALEAPLAEDIKRLGAHGYTVTEARGEGSRGSRSGDWDQSSNIRMEIICETRVKDSIVQHLNDRYYRDYAMVLYITDVEVLRPEKF